MSRIAPLLAWYTQLTPANLDQLAEFYTADAQFKDPFNDVSGHAAIRQIFAHMFTTTSNPRFSIDIVLEQGEQAFVTWRFDCGIQGKAYTMRGASHFLLDEQGRVRVHRDYWDPAEELWQKLPVLGPLVRWLRRKFSATR